MIKLLVMDMNGTLMKEHSSILLAEAIGKKKEAEKIVEMRSNGKIAKGTNSTTRLLKGMEMEKAKKIIRGIEPEKKMKKLVNAMKEKGIECIILTTGYDIAANSLAGKLGIKEAYSNRLLEKNGVLTGEYVRKIVTPEDKVEIVEKIRKEKSLKKKEIAVIGDSQSDLGLFERYKGFAYHQKNVLQDKGIVILDPLEILEYLDDK